MNQPSSSFSFASSIITQVHYQQTANHIYHKMTGNSDDVKIDLLPSITFAAAHTEQKILFFHPLTLLKPEDLPEELHVESPDDPKLQSNEYFNKLKEWLAKTFTIEPTKLESLPELLNMHLHLWKNPQLIDRIKHFAIAHEIGHILLQHTSGRWAFFFSMTVSLVMIIILLGLFPFFLAVLLSITVVHISNRVFKALREYSEQYREKEADLAAIQYTKDLPAAAAFFQAIDKSTNHYWNQLPWYNKLLRVLFLPESLFHISHPSPQARIQNIQNFVKA